MWLSQEIQWPVVLRRLHQSVPLSDYRAVEIYIRPTWFLALLDPTWRTRRCVFGWVTSRGSRLTEWLTQRTKACGLVAGFVVPFTAQLARCLHRRAKSWGVVLL